MKKSVVLLFVFTILCSLCFAEIVVPSAGVDAGGNWKEQLSMIFLGLLITAIGWITKLINAWVNSMIAEREANTKNKYGKMALQKANRLVVEIVDSAGDDMIKLIEELRKDGKVTTQEAKDELFKLYKEWKREIGEEAYGELKSFWFDVQKIITGKLKSCLKSTLPEKSSGIPTSVHGV